MSKPNGNTVRRNLEARVKKMEESVKALGKTTGETEVEVNSVKLRALDIEASYGRLSQVFRDMREEQAIRVNALNLRMEWLELPIWTRAWRRISQFLKDAKEDIVFWLRTKLYRFRG